MVVDRRRLATALWIAWAVIVWNVVFDHVLVMAGRDYVNRAGVAALGRGPYLRIADAMGPAVPHALRIASAAAGLILAVGLPAVSWAARRARPSRS